jgi:hypothetical protein
VSARRVKYRAYALLNTVRVKNRQSPPLRPSLNLDFLVPSPTGCTLESKPTQACPYIYIYIPRGDRVIGSVPFGRDLLARMSLEASHVCLGRRWVSVCLGPMDEYPGGSGLFTRKNCPLYTRSISYQLADLTRSIRMCDSA